MLRESEDTIRENLYLCAEEYDCYWNDWKDDIIKTIRKYEDIYGDEHFYDWCYCLESDFDTEQLYEEEMGRTIVEVANENGLIIYEWLDKKE